MEQITQNLDAWRQRALLGLGILRQQEQVDPEKIAAIGYCFGGATVMQLAYSGADLAGVVSFHGSLPLPTPADLGRIQARILVEHGSADGFVPAERVARFQEALEKAGADWRMVINGGAKHSFTNPGADAYGIDGLGYDAEADRRSWQDMQRFFVDIFGEDKP
jgi:dienelactone hydrolase